MLRVSHKNKATAFYTGERVQEKHWEGNRVNPRVGGAMEINRNIEQKRASLEKLVRDMEFETPDKSFTTEDIRKRFLPMIRVVDSRVEGALLPMIDKYVKSVKLEPRTKKIYQAVKKHLEKYQQAAEQSFSLYDVDAEFVKDFYSFLQQSIGDNTAHKIVVRMKAVINWSSKQGVKTNPTFRNFKTKEFQKEVIFLSWDELMKLWEMEPEPSLDLYLFSCFTGLRKSDVSAFNYATDVRNGFIRIRQVKTKDEAVIPLNRFSEAILKRHNYGLPDIIDWHKVNEDIRNCAASAGINSKEKKVSWVKGERKEEIKPKYQLLSMHTGRSTFIMQNLMKGVSPLAVMKMSGHKDFAAFQKYVRFSDDLLKELSDKVWG